MGETERETHREREHDMHPNGAGLTQPTKGGNALKATSSSSGTTCTKVWKNQAVFIKIYVCL